MRKSEQKLNRNEFWNYSSPASYFLTACIYDNHEILGKVANEKMILSDEGEIVKSEIFKIPAYNKRVILEEWVVMPNHIHLLIILGKYGFDNGNSKTCSLDRDRSILNEHKKIAGLKEEKERLKKFKSLRRYMLIPKIMGKLKTLTSI